MKKDDAVEVPAQADFVYDQIQLILAEKRTALSTMRTGIAVFALPISAFSVLIVMSKYYEPARVLQWLVPLIALCLGLIVLGCYLISIAVVRIRRYDRHIQALKVKHAELAQLLD
jgi:Na+/melibiose symporter-like transporter